jgi:hypothetical protein
MPAIESRLKDLLDSLAMLDALTLVRSSIPPVRLQASNHVT